MDLKSQIFMAIKDLCVTQSVALMIAHNAADIAHEHYGNTKRPVMLKICDSVGAGAEYCDSCDHAVPHEEIVLPVACGETCQVAAGAKCVDVGAGHGA